MWLHNKLPEKLRTELRSLESQILSKLLNGMCNVKQKA